MNPQIKIIESDSETELVFNDISMNTFFLSGEELYLKITEDDAINILRCCNIKFRSSTIVDNCNLEIKIIK